MRWTAALLLLATARAATLTQCEPELAPTATYIQQAATEFHVPPSLLAAVAIRESGGSTSAQRYEPAFRLTGDWNAASAAGWSAWLLKSSLGEFQIMGAVAWRDLNAHYPPSEIFDASLNARLAAKYLAQLRASSLSWEAALAYYNQGLPGVERLVSGKRVAYVSEVINKWGDIAACEAQK